MTTPRLITPTILQADANVMDLCHEYQTYESIDLDDTAEYSDGEEEEAISEVQTVGPQQGVGAELRGGQGTQGGSGGLRGLRGGMSKAMGGRGK